MKLAFIYVEVNRLVIEDGCILQTNGLGLKFGTPACKYLAFVTHQPALRPLHMLQEKWLEEQKSDIEDLEVQLTTAQARSVDLETRLADAETSALDQVLHTWLSR